MEELKLYKVYYLGDSSCWNLRVARSPEEALLKCFDRTDRNKPADAHEKSCRVEEVLIDGYRIKIEQV
jgi:hypothetical protein